MLFRAREHRGFTLIDVMAALIIVGTAIAAVMNFLGASTSANGTAGRNAIAIVLANNIHEYALSLDPKSVPPTNPLPGLSYVDQLNGRNFSPPRDARGGSIANMALWGQQVTVTSVNRDALSTDVTPTDETVRRVRVVVTHRGRAVHSATWLVAPSVKQGI
jgi:prepilin-type N-terminal cleavage/methylation domain-containing protein